ncbi:FMN-dependent NADH-azoreductase [Idiomarina seosinensis]|uniref:FMN dependent NADH:quinone oxidoreductase n=1 Tax=Idiomarina seosinensis TaxID=281739 RepID=A0A432ZHS4_9GAMM|nr:NAD(P)H-dependent oxidoreductase [Idiomarina seosinensis]RUO77575.1 FMN-dependent NADH-azoreductase [Idiomarina seosinensis]
MNILHLDSGIFVEQSVSRQLSADIVRKLTQEADATVTHRDLVTQTIPHLQAEELLAEDKPLINELIEELQQSDVLVIGAPMYNFTIPTQLKTWFDRVLQAGITFRYTESGPEGLLSGKKAYIASGRGGIYSSGDAAALDHQESYLRTVLAFIGITDVQVVRAEGLNMGDEPRAEGLAKAAADIAAIV